MRVVLTRLLCALALNASALAVTPDLAAPSTTMDAAGTILEGGWHSAPLGTQGTPEGDAVLAYIARWFQEQLAR